MNNDVKPSAATSGEAEYAATGSTECGVGVCRPRWLRRLAGRRTMLFWLCWFCAVQGLLVNGLVPSVLSTLERRFRLSAASLGRIMQFYDVGYVLCCIPVSYFGGRHSKPLFLAAGIFMMGCGALVFSLPHFLSDPYIQGKSGGIISYCGQSGSTTGASVAVLANESVAAACDLARSADTLNGIPYMSIFCAAHFLHGVGATPLFTLGVSYIDENVRPTSSSLYLGIFYAFAVFGPAIGFFLSSTLLHYPTDFLLQQDLMLLEAGESDPDWVGAWWVGFLLAAVFAYIAVLPILSFPRVLPSAVRWQQKRARKSLADDVPLGHRSSHVEEFSPIEGPSSSAAGQPPQPADVPAAEDSAAVTNADLQQCGRGLLGDLKHIPAALVKLFTNGTFVMISVGAAIDALLFAGMTTFMATYLEKQFQISPSKSSWLIGCIMVPMAGLGTMTSGYVVKRFQLSCRMTMKFSIATVVVSLLMSPMFLIYCSRNQLVGIQTTYPETNFSSSAQSDVIALESACNAGCACRPDEFGPVCAPSAGHSFYSSCYAGCVGRSHPDGAFAECLCAPGGRVERGWCESRCAGLVPFLALFAVMIFCAFCVGVPLLSVVLRCVDYNERSFALGIQWILMRCIGTIPAPAIFAYFFDRACIRRATPLCAERQGEGAACLLSDNSALASYWTLFAVVCQTVTLLFIALGLVLLRGTAADKPSSLDQDNTLDPQQNSTAAGEAPPPVVTAAVTVV